MTKVVQEPMDLRIPFKRPGSLLRFTYHKLLLCSTHRCTTLGILMCTNQQLN